MKLKSKVVFIQTIILRISYLQQHHRPKKLMSNPDSKSQLLDHIDQIGVGIECDDLFLGRGLAGVLCVENVIEFLELKVE